jgi:hypothetical protein
MRQEIKKRIKDLAHRRVQPDQSSDFFHVCFRLLVISQTCSGRGPRTSVEMSLSLNIKPYVSWGLRIQSMVAAHEYPRQSLRLAQRSFVAQ